MDFLPPELDSYIEAHTTPDEPLLAELAARTHAELESPQMLSGTVEGRLLETLVFITGARRVLEFGTFSGYSALSMAAALPEDGQLFTLELDPDRAAFARSYMERSPHGRKIETLVGPALESVARLEGPFDLAFIDADKEGYVDYYEAALARLAPRGLIVADNTLWSGRVVDADDTSEGTVGIRRFNDHVRDDTRVRSVILSVRDGVTLIRRAG
ncbi:MAG: caffeoyl-CoA O-methyltransferase [Gaiellaceae bacterium]|nr:caffeoyl-CoA O-methyltransferase [Gaiellaceae bacterium]